MLQIEYCWNSRWNGWIMKRMSKVSNEWKEGIGNLNDDRIFQKAHLEILAHKLKSMIVLT